MNDHSGTGEGGSVNHIALYLLNLEKKQQVVRDLVTAVAKNFKTGLYLFGSGGLGKSYTVLSQLRKLDVPYQLHNSRMTEKAFS